MASWWDIDHRVAKRALTLTCLLCLGIPATSFIEVCPLNPKSQTLVFAMPRSPYSLWIYPETLL